MTTTHLKSTAVENLFLEIDEATKRFAADSKISCPSRCGRCCENPKLETTVLDMLPLAFFLKAENRLEAVAATAMDAYQSHCIFYESFGEPGLGRCTVYPYRPSICRLFGFAATRDKNRTPQLAACKIHKQTQPEIVENAKSQVEAGHIDSPLFMTYANRLAEIDPSLATQFYQINEALLRAVEKVALLPS